MRMRIRMRMRMRMFLVEVVVVRLVFFPCLDSFFFSLCLAVVVAFSHIDIVVKSLKVFLFSSLSHFRSVLLGCVAFFILAQFSKHFIEIKWPRVKKFPAVLFSIFH